MDAAPPSRSSASVPSHLLVVLLQPHVDFPYSQELVISSAAPARVKCHQVLMNAPSPQRDLFFVKFGYAAMTSDLDHKRQVPHRQDHTNARTTTYRNTKSIFEHVRLPPTSDTSSPTTTVYNYRRPRRTTKREPLLPLQNMYHYRRPNIYRACTTTIGEDSVDVKFLA
ncbi:hypothetical protein TRIUR3_30657 [Triticum urartu]|uniref:Uncharacterized protein n=1 Tax=Triticum urartu TaxID=4572 RepID=M8AN18_TRIUA|nr:hypothetical protein TRIUR3_30657 [Triticum urartu]